MFTHTQAYARIQNIIPRWCVCVGGVLKFIGEFRSIFSVIFAKFEFSREGPDALPSLP